MRANLQPLFGEVPPDADNLEIVGEFPPRFEKWKDATVWPQSGAVRRFDGEVEYESIWIRENLPSCWDYQSIWSRFPRVKKGEYFNLTLFWWNNYYHWNCDILPRLLLALRQLPPDTRVILPPNLTAWQRRSLGLLGLPSERCVEYSGRRPWKVKGLLWVSPLSMTGDHHSQGLNEVRHIVLSRVIGKPSISGHRRLYLQRKNTHGRRVSNESALLPILEDFGFENIDCADLSYDEQVNLFSQARIVVGPHGAAFTNLLWSPPDTQVLEIFEPGSVRRCYWSLSAALGHAYSCAVATASKQPGREADLVIDQTLFAGALKRVVTASDRES
jgi:capsular polysaccharide biosynthesis protein